MSGQIWGTASLGGYMAAFELSDLLRMQVRATCRSRNLCDAKDFSDKGLHRGQTVTWNVYSKLAGTATTLTEGTSMPTSNYTITQGTATVTEWGISVPFTSVAEMFAMHDLKAVTRNVLARSAAETMDLAAGTQFAACLLRYVGTNSAAAGVLTTNGTATATNSSPLNKYHVRAIVDTMKERNIPGYQGDDYVCLARPTTFRTFRNELEDVGKYTDPGYRKIINGEIGRFEGVRFVEQSNILAGTAYNGTAWTSGLSDWARFMGSDTVSEIVSIPPEVRGKIPGDYGRDLGMAWYALEGFGIVYSSSNDSGGTNSRIIQWDSAA